MVKYNCETCFRKLLRHYMKNFSIPLQDRGDCEQDAVIKLFLRHALGRCTSPEECDSRQPWLAKVAHNAVLDYKEKQGTIQKHEVSFTSLCSDTFNPLNHIPDPSPTPEEVLIETASRVQMQQAVQEALQSLPSDERQLLIDYFQIDLSVKAIAQRDGLCERTVQYRLKKARKLFLDSLTYLCNSQ
jgi:RNA polymerase sigma factor (sigma-70 family)